MEVLYGTAAQVLKMVATVAEGEISLAWGLKDDLKKLQLTMSTVKAVLLDAEKKQQENEELRVWLRRLKDVFLDAQDVLGEFDCELLRREAVKMHGSLGRKVRRFFSRSNPLAFRLSIAHQIKAIRQELDEVAKDRSNFHLEEHHDERHVLEGRREVTDSFVRPSEVIGRESVKEEIINTLMEKENDADLISVIPIVGIGGLGKTTLAKLVYNDDRVTREFDLKMWVCVSLDFNVAELRKEILKSAITATDGVTDENFSVDEALKRAKNISNLSSDQIQMFLRSTLKDKKFLLVLDDVWNEDRGKWNEVRDLLLTACGKGSKIIMTTRNSSVSSVAGTTPPHNLECLSEEESRSLFFKYVFGDERLVENFPKLKSIGWQIVEKCRGIPLALKSLGSLLRSETDERVWIFVKNNEIWKLKEQNDPLLSALRLSYSTMPSYLKQCFAYCSLIPKNFREANLEMIYIWMALDIIQSPNDKIDMEDIGKMYFNELCNRSFFQYLQDAKKTLNVTQEFEMHDLIHDLASSIIQYEHSTINSYTTTAPDERVRHLRIFMKDGHGQSILTILEKLKKVRSIFLNSEADEELNIEESFLSTCISRFRHLRLFDLSGFSFAMLPSSIGTLKHLRYLCLNENKKIRELPDSICNLQSLQTLWLDGCSELEELPRDISNLLSLRNLSVTTKQTCFPENGVGRLRSLQFLYIEKCKNLKSLPHDMRFCTTLRTLFICECEQLNLASRPVDQVMQLSLQTLMIDELPQTTALPQWLEGAAHTLQRLLIGGCPELVALPEWLPNLTSLENLVITSCPKLSSLPEGMHRLTSLTHLGIADCYTLEKRCKREVGEDWPKIAHIPDLSICLESDDDD